MEQSWPKNGLQGGKSDAHHVFDERAPWQPAAERAVHCRRASELRATRRPTPCASKSGCPSCPGIPHSLPLASVALPARSLALLPRGCSPWPWPPLPSDRAPPNHCLAPLLCHALLLTPPTAPFSFPTSHRATWPPVSPALFTAAAELAAPLCPLASALHRSPLIVAHPCAAHTAPLDLLDRRHWPLLLPAVGAAADAAAATVAAPPQAASDQAGQPSVCARDPWSSPPLHRRCRRP